MKKTNEKETEADNIDTQTEETPERRLILTEDDIALLQWARKVISLPVDYEADVLLTLYLKQMPNGYIRPFRVSSESILFKDHRLESTEESNEGVTFKISKPDYFG